MNFQFYYKDTKGRDKRIRVDADNEIVARDRFKRMYPRYTVIRVVDITNLVKNLGLSCY